MRTFIAAKLHGLVVTGCRLEYHGSVTIADDLLDDVGIDPYEQVHVVNLNSGARWVTYALAGPPGTFELNGGGARLGVVGDRCVVMTYQQAEAFPGAVAVHVNALNGIHRRVPYARP